MEGCYVVRSTEKGPTLVVLKLGRALESSEELKELLIHRLLHRTIESESLGVRPRH